jgi:Mrp family chromosome partitioning ATPase
MDELREYLQKNYDVIIIDTPPFGIVADAQILGKIVDTTLIVTRFGYTMKEQVSEIEKWSRNNIKKI